MGTILRVLPPLMSKDERYLMNQIVVIIAETHWFNLMKVRYKEDSSEFFVDAKLLTLTPDNTHTINLNLLGGSHHDS
jgi:hypothetical protein